jgi:adenylate cyclase
MTRRTWQRRKTLLLLAVATLAAGLGLVAYATNVFRRQEFQTIDARFQIRGKHKPPSNIVIVAIDEPTVAALNQRVPFPRHYQAGVISRLSRAGASVIGMDIQFTQPTDPYDDNALINAIGAAHNIVLATTDIGPHGTNNVLGGGSLVTQLGARAAAALFSADSDGSIRRTSYAVSGLPTLDAAIADDYSGHPVAAARIGTGSQPIDYYGPPGTFPTISFSRVYNGNFPANMFRGKIVLVGDTRAVDQDLHQTPTGTLMAGVEIHANAVATILDGVPLHFSPAWADVLLILLVGIFVPLASLRVHPMRALLSGVLLAVGYTIAAQLAFNGGNIITYIYPMFALTLATVTTLAVIYVGEAFERQHVRDLFGRFVPPDVVDEVLARTDDNLRLGGVQMDATVMFSDLRGFTSFAETQPAARVIEVVNFYLNEMTEAILDARGTLVAYMGDGIFAVFGAPIEQPDHADRALRAAREMIGPRLERFNEWLREQGLSEDGFRMGVGLNSGPVMSGMVGAQERVEYAAIGDTTNTASRLEGMTKGTPHMLFVSGTTKDRMHEAPADLTFVDDFEVRGRTAKLPVWTLTADAATPSGDHPSAPAAASG